MENEEQIARDLETILTTIGQVRVATVFWRDPDGQVRFRTWEVEGKPENIRQASMLAKAKGTVVVTGELDVPAIVDLDPPDWSHGEASG